MKLIWKIIASYGGFKKADRIMSSFTEEMAFKISLKHR